jgi:hypothetical protein
MLSLSEPVLDSFNFLGRYRFPVQITVNFQTVDIDILQFGQREISLFGIRHIVIKHDVAEKQVFAVKFCHIPVTTPDEEMQVYDLFLQRYAFRGVQPGNLVQKFG